MDSLSKFIGGAFVLFFLVGVLHAIIVDLLERKSYGFRVREQRMPKNKLGWRRITKEDGDYWIEYPEVPMKRKLVPSDLFYSGQLLYDKEGNPYRVSTVYDDTHIYIRPLATYTQSCERILCDKVGETYYFGKNHVGNAICLSDIEYQFLSEWRKKSWEETQAKALEHQRQREFLNDSWYSAQESRYKELLKPIPTPRNAEQTSKVSVNIDPVSSVSTNNPLVANISANIGPVSRVSENYPVAANISDAKKSGITHAGVAKHTEDKNVSYLFIEGVQWLYHFTDVRNLPGISREGLLSRMQLGVKGIPFTYNDENEAQSDYISTSIEWPNYKMFYRLRLQHPDITFAVLALSADLLREHSYKLYKTNAATGGGASCVENAQDLYYESDSRKCLDSCKYPTDPQAEIRVKGNIPVKYIRSIYLETDDSRNICIIPAGFKDIVCVNRQYFFPRSDYRYWS